MDSSSWVGWRSFLKEILLAQPLTGWVELSHLKKDSERAGAKEITPGSENIVNIEE